jgi:DNA-binding CsgD family transcriptional regulator
MIVCTPELERAAHEYTEHFQHEDLAHLQRYDPKLRAVFHHTDIYDMAAYRETAVYHEWVVPHRLHDTLALSVAEGPTAVPTSVYLYRGDPVNPFAERHRALLEAVYPAFEAGIRTRRVMGGWREALWSHLDGADLPALAFDWRGKLVYQSRAFDAIIPQADAGSLRSAARRLAHDAQGVWRGASLQAPGATRIGSSVYTLTASVYPDGLGTPRFLTLVLLARQSAGVTDEILRTQFRLTSREVQVARALAGDSSLDAIAEALGISVHTLRRHGEQVYKKLGVNTRQQLAVRLTRG